MEDLKAERFRNSPRAKGIEGAEGIFEMTLGERWPGDLPIRLRSPSRRATHPLASLAEPQGASKILWLLPTSSQGVRLQGEGNQVTRGKNIQGPRTMTFLDRDWAQPCRTLVPTARGPTGMRGDPVDTAPTCSNREIPINPALNGVTDNTGTDRVPTTGSPSSPT